MSHSLTAMRVWLQMGAEDRVEIQWKNRRPRAEARAIVMVQIGLEMQGAGYRIQDYQADVDEIVDAVLYKVYGEEHVETETVARQTASTLQQNKVK